MRSRLILNLFFLGLFGCSSLPRSLERGVVYKSVDHVDLKLDVYSPEQKAPRAAVIVVHGGGWNERSGDMQSICRALAKAGFVAFNTTYRLAPTHPYPKAVEDVEDTVKWVEMHAAEYGVDTRRIGIWGYSAGANLALLATLDTNIGVRAIVSGGTPADLTRWPDSPLVNGFIGFSQKDKPELWKEASPVFHVTGKSPPVYLYHGEWDMIVDRDQVDFMARALKEKNRPYEIHMVPFMGHLAVYLLSQESVDIGIQFLRKYL